MDEQFLFTNVLQIPNLFNASYVTTSRVGFILFSVMFIAAILHENFQAMAGKSNYTGFFVRTLLVISLFILYDRFFVWIVYGSNLLSEAILPHEDFKEVIKAVFNEIVQKKDLGKLSFRIVVTVMNYFTYSVALALLGVLTWLRFIFLSLLFVFGPILVGVGIYQSTSQGLRFWLKSLVGVSSWNVVLSILMKVVSTMNITAIYFPVETNQVSILAGNLLFILLFISVPLIANQVTSGSSISSLGSAIVGVWTAVVTRHISRTTTRISSKHLPTGTAPDLNSKEYSYK